MALYFLEKKDLTTQIFEEYLDDSIEDDLEVLETVELENIAMMKGKLRERYDVTKIFSELEYEDKPLIKKMLSALVNYAIVKRNKARKIPSTFNEEYRLAMDWLKEVKQGKEMPALPILETARKEVKWGNNKNEEHYY
jgi:phage gp36-like protein